MAAFEAEAAAAGPSGWTAAAAAAAAANVNGSSSLVTLTQRYAALVAAGTLRHDPHQEACVQRLEVLRQELRRHHAAVAAYQAEHAAYQQRRQALAARLVEEEEARLQAEEAAAEEAAASRLTGVSGWISAALEAPEEPQLSPPPRRTRHQRRVLARARVEPRLGEQLGLPPAPPAAPKGVYLHGSVGSGKSLAMDLFSAAVLREGTVPHHRRLHFNSAMLELHSRMHAIESGRMARQRQQMDAYAAALREQQERDHERQQHQQPVGPAAAGEASAGTGAGGGSSSSSGSSSTWQQLLRLDPIAQKLRRSKLARLAYRRMMRDKVSRSPDEHSAALAAANAPVLRDAARALIRNCDTLQLAASAAAAEGEAGGGGGGPTLAAVLCFDEVQVTDPFTAVALKGLVEALLAEGCVVVATSNRAPWELDRQGLHEDLFEHFRASLQAACDVVCLDSGRDYRRLLAASTLLRPLPAAGAAAGAGRGDNGTTGMQLGAAAAPAPHASYFFPLGPAAEAALEHQWRALTAAGDQAAPATDDRQQQEQQRGAGRELGVMFGRRLHVARCAGGAARFSFPELCAVPLGTADYVALSQTFHTVFLEGVPPLSMQVRDQARRFISLVDELYNHRTRLVCTAAAPPDQLFSGAGAEGEGILDLEGLQFEGAVEGARLRRDVGAQGGVAPVAGTPAEAAAAAARLGGAEERFAFARAVSRLYEMQGELYLASRPRQP